MGGSAKVETDLVQTTGAQTYTYRATVSVASGPVDLSGGTVTFDSTLDGASDLLVGGDAVFDGAVGSSTPLGSLHVTGSADVNTGQVDTTGDQTYDGGVVLGSSVDLSGGTVTFGSQVHAGLLGANLLVSGNAVFDGFVGISGSDGGDLKVTGSTDLNAGIASANCFTFDGPVNLSGGSETVIGSGECPIIASGGRVLFDSTVDGAADLTIEGPRVEFHREVGGSTPLKSLHVDDALVDTDLVQTTGAQTYGGVVSLSRSRSSVDLSGGRVTFDAQLDNQVGGLTGGNLTVTGDAVFNGEVGSGTPLGSLHVTGTTSINTGQVDTNANQQYDGGISLLSDAALSSSSGAVEGAGVSLLSHTITLGGAGSLSGVISGTGGLIKQGPGALTLSGTNTYTGATGVQDGSLNVAGTVVGAVTIASGATVSVSGTVGGLVTVQTAGSLTCGGGTLNGGVTNNGGTATSVPDKPTNVSAVAGDKNATVSFTPGSANCFPVSYTATASPGGADASGSSPITVGGLSDGQSYTFTVTATNPIGTAVSQPSNTVAPAATPTITTSQQPASATVGSSIADKATVSGGYNPTGTVTFNLYNNPTGTARRCSPTPRRSSGGMATSAGYTADGDGHRLLGRHLQRRQQQHRGHQRHRPRAGDHQPGHPGDQHPAAAGRRHRRQLDRRQGDGHGGYNPTGTVTFNLYNNPTGTARRCSPTPRRSRAARPLGGLHGDGDGHRLLGRHLQRRQQQHRGHQRHRLEPVTISPASPAINTSQQPASGDGRHARSPTRRRVTAATTRPGRSRSTSTTTRTARGTPLFTDANEPLVGGMATSAGYTATATGTDYWVATYNGDSNNSSATSGTALEPVTITPARPRSTPASSRPRDGGQLDRRQGDGQRRYNPTGTVTFNLYNNSTATGTPLFTDERAAGRRHGHLAGYTATADGHRLLGRHLQRRQQQQSPSPAAPAPSR